MPLCLFLLREHHYLIELFLGKSNLWFPLLSGASAWTWSRRLLLEFFDKLLFRLFVDDNWARSVLRGVSWWLRQLVILPFTHSHVISSRCNFFFRGLVVLMDRHFVRLEFLSCLYLLKLNSWGLWYLYLLLFWFHFLDFYLRLSLIPGYLWRQLRGLWIWYLYWTRHCSFRGSWRLLAREGGTSSGLNPARAPPAHWSLIPLKRLIIIFVISSPAASTRLALSSLSCYELLQFR